MTSVLELATPTGIDMSQAPVATPEEARAAFRLAVPAAPGLTPAALSEWVAHVGGRFASDDELRSGRWE